MAGGLASATTAAGQSRPDTLRHAQWQLLWGSEFNTPGDSSVVADHWRFAYPWGHNLGGYEDQYYSGQQVAVDSAGLLHLRARRRAEPRPYAGRQLHYESALLFSTHRRDSLMSAGCPEGSTGFSFGLFEIRCRLPRKEASSSSFWLFGHPDEVDVFEAGSPPEIIGNNIILWSHPYWRPGPLGADKESSQSFYYWPGPGSITDDFHTFALSWQPDEMVYYFDGIAIRHETRYLPLGCPLDVIANLAMMSWSRDRADTYDIDYIRVYTSRQPAPTPPVTPVGPVVGVGRLPRATVAVLGEAGAEMSWQVQEPPGQRPRLALQQNLNPREFNFLALPVRQRWLTPLVAYHDVNSPRHRIASPDGGRSSLSWTVYDLCGQPVLSGQQLPAAGWELAWPTLAPGAYSLRLRMGTCQVRQTMYVLGRPDEVVFTPEWLAPPTQLPAAAND
ncbi:hypothetical protein GCM10028824_39210 [Hymenobacter segetis]